MRTPAAPPRRWWRCAAKRPVLLGIISSIGAFGGFVVPLAYAWSKSEFGTIQPALRFYVAFFIVLLAVTWFLLPAQGALAWHKPGRDGDSDHPHGVLVLRCRLRHRSHHHDRAGARPVIASCDRGQVAPRQLRPVVHQGSDPRRDDGRRRRAAEIGAGAALPRRRASARLGRRRRRRGRHATARDHRRARTRRGRPLRLRPDVASRRSIWPTSWPRASCGRCTSSRTRGCAWPARVPDTSSRWAPTGRPAPTPTSIAPTCFSSSARTWPTAIRSCSCGWRTG